MNIEKQVVDAVGNKREPKLGDKVIHRLSGKHGVVSEIGLVDNQHIVSITLSSGQIMAKLNWREISLDASMMFPVQQPEPTIEGVQGGRWEVAGLDGPISTDSILEELV